MKENCIAAKSKAAIKHAFLELMEQKQYTKITVRELAGLAGVNRSTFYSHYKDIYDLLEQIENEIIDDVRDKVSNIRRENYVPGQHPQHVRVFEALIAHEDECRVILGQNGDINFLGKLQDYLRLAFWQCNENYYDPVPEKLDLCASYVSSAIVGTFVRNLYTKKFTAEDLGFFAGEITNWIDQNLVLGGILIDEPEPEPELSYRCCSKKRPK